MSEAIFMTRQPQIMLTMIMDIMMIRNTKMVLSLGFDDCKCFGDASIRLPLLELLLGGHDEIAPRTSSLCR
jgi:hypothetical protein